MAQINKPNEYFNTKLYTGNGSTQSITGVNFQPDWVWIKDRNLSYNHALFDAVRGTTKLLQSNTTNAEQTTSGVSSFDSDGFTLGSDIGMNQSSGSFASWNWLAGGTASSNTDGSITSSVSANTTNGFSIVTFTGTGANATIGHGLNSVPSTIILKGYSNTPSWYVYHQAVGNQNYLNLNNSNATGTPDSAYWNSTTPTSSVFSIGVGGDVNGSGQTMVAYCFADVKGFSKMGSYVGNGNADGTFIYTGFKPSWVMIKRSSGTQAWMMYDNKRSVFNTTNDLLFANTSGAESVDNSVGIDFLSNGFKCRSADDGINSGSYIYMAFAENPLVGTNGVPATAR